tara:strand:- start:28268 stop:29434 length:1167 start_codon:yes stop_codon:yes gene_type:complete
MKKICVFVGSRANYSSIKSVMNSIKNHKNLELQVVIGSSSVLERYGKVEDLIIKDGFKIDYKFYNIVEGENPLTMAKSTGLGIIEFSTILDNLNSDFLIVVGDRFEMMSVTIAAAYMNIRIAHTMGGEVTGTIDESIRHAITKFSHLHFTASSDAYERVVKLGEDPKYVFNTGCPRMDLVKEELKNDSIPILSDFFKNNKGVGSNVFDFSKPFLLVSQHPVTTEYKNNRNNFQKTLNAINKLNIQTIMLWPNIDAGSDKISKSIRSFRENNPDSNKWLTVFKNLPIKVYIHLMNTTACLIGNSSSGIREGATIGTPVVNIGTRQNQRQMGGNVINSGYNDDEILNSIKRQLGNGKHPPSDIYGSGNAGNTIANLLHKSNPPVQKIIIY